MMGNKFWSELSATIKGLAMIKTAASEGDPLAALEMYRAKSGGNVVSEEYFNQWETRNYIFRGNDFPSEQEAMKARGEAAKLLRSLGWEVKVKTVGFSDLARARGFFLEARKPRQSGPEKIPVSEATAKGFFKSAKSMGWGLYQVEELDGGLGSIWHVEKDAATGEQFLVKQIDPVGDIVRRVRTASAKIRTAAEVPPPDYSQNPAPGTTTETPCRECGRPLGAAYFLDDLGICTRCVRKKHRDVAGSISQSKKTAAIEPGAEGPLSVGDDDLEPAPAQPAVAPAPMSDMVRSYLGTALWSSNDESTDSGGKPMDDSYQIEDFAPEAVAKAVADCALFEEKAGPLLEGIHRQGRGVPDIIGFDFWLTRNGHGSGFWDNNGKDFSEEVGEALTKISKEFGETDAYVGDDGKLHLS